MNDVQWRAAWRICEKIADFSSAEQQAALESTNDPEIAAQVRAVLAEDNELCETEPASVDAALRETAFPEPGVQIGRYRLKCVVGHGGAGQVYSAEDFELGRTVALKFLLPRAYISELMAEQFVHEAQAASALNHPNIVTVHEVVRSQRGLAIVMELVEGISLRQLCKSPIPAQEVMRLGRQIAEALAAAHSRQIIHRDIKPENIMVRPDGYVKVLDFGLAREMAVTASRNPEGSIAHTIPAGTWRYMSPEQSRGEKLTTASDVFSLGLVLYEMCTRRHPFPAESPLAAAEAIATQAPGRLAPQDPQIPLSLDRLIVEMLDKRPEARPTAERVARSLDASLENPATLTERRRGYRLALAAVAFLLCARATVFIAEYVGAHRQPVLTQITSNESENRVTAAGISADGAMLAYADPDGLFVRSVRTSDTRPLHGPANLHVDKIAWFPDGSRLLVSGFETSALDSSLWIVPVTAGKPMLIRKGAGNGDPSPDGTRIAFTANNDSEIWVAARDGHRPRKLISGSVSEAFPVLFWSADGKRLSFERRQYRPRTSVKPKMRDEFEANFEFSYESADAVSGNVLAITKNTIMKSACALRDGRILFQGWGLPGDRWTENIWQVQTDKASGAFHSTPRQVTHLRKSSKAFALTASADGKHAAAIIESDEADVYLGDLQQGSRMLANPRRLTLNSKVEYPHIWTPDNRAVIFESDRGGNFDLFKQAIDGRVAEVIVTEPTDDVFAQATPDGRWLLYAAAEPSDFWTRWALMRVPLNGGRPEKLLDGNEQLHFRCPLYGAGSCILREAEEHRQFVFYELDPLKGKGRELGRTRWMPTLLGDWDVSPDGSTVAMPYHELSQGRIRLVQFGHDGETEVAVPGFSTLRSVAWAADGNGWFGAAQTQVGDDLIHIDPSGGAQLLRETAGNTWPVPSPNGRCLAFVDYGVDSNVWTLERY